MIGFTQIRIDFPMATKNKIEGHASEFQHISRT